MEKWRARGGDIKWRTEMEKVLEGEILNGRWKISLAPSLRRSLTQNTTFRC